MRSCCLASKNWSGNDNAGIFFRNEASKTEFSHKVSGLNEYFDNEVVRKKNKLATKVRFLEMPISLKLLYLLKTDNNASFRSQNQ
jgi:hypothetical protein